MQMKKIVLFLLPLILFSHAQSALAAIVIEHTTINANATNDVTFNHNGGDGTNDVVILISHRYGATCIDGITYAGVSATKDSTNTDLAYIYRVSGATSGVNSVYVNFCSGSVGRDNRVVALTLSGVDETAPVVDDEYKISGANIATPFYLLATSTVDGALSVSAFTASASFSPIVHGGQTNISSGALGTYIHGIAYEYITTAGYNPQSWSGGSGTGDYAGVIVVYRPVPVDPPPETSTTSSTTVNVNTQNIEFILIAIFFILSFLFFGVVFSPFKKT